MNILFSAGFYGKTPIANNVIELALANYLAAKGHKCVILGGAYDTIKNYTTEHGTSIIRVSPNKFLSSALNVYDDYLDKYPNSSKLNFALRHPINAIKIFLYYKLNINSKPITHKIYVQYVKRIIKAESIDTVIGFAYPFEFAQCVLNAELPNVKKVYYQLDPYGTHKTYLCEKEAEKTRDEAEVISRCVAAFTTYELYEEYKAHPAYKDVLHKINPIGFPGIKALNTDAPHTLSLDKNSTNIVFCGGIFNDIRNPDNTLLMAEKIIGLDSTVKFYFVGTHQGGLIEDMAKKHPHNIILHGSVDATEAQRIISNADVLLNICSNIENMVGSKLFEYVCTGRPILNIQTANNCPNRKYADKYPLALTVLDKDAKHSAQQVLNFINNNKAERVALDLVQKLYYNYTLEHVANTLLNGINNALGEKQ